MQILKKNLRRDSPTGSRLSQHLLFCIAAWSHLWSLISADVKAAFLKGDSDVNRELYLTKTNEKVSPPLPIQAGQLCRVLKGIFGLADAPREWWLRLSRSMQGHGRRRSIVDAACWFFWEIVDGMGRLAGMTVAHVGDLLFTGNKHAEQSLRAIGAELGFGSMDSGSFTWCGKHIRRAEDHTIRLTMAAYHANLSEVVITKHRKSNVDAVLDKHEHKQLRAVLGSLQWLVAQIRYDMSFCVSSLQGENPPTVGTLIRATAAVREFRRTGDFELVFKPIDYMSAGICAVSDAALGNVKLNGSSAGTSAKRIYSQACYFCFLCEESMLRGKQGAFNILDARSHRTPRLCRSTYTLLRP